MAVKSRFCGCDLLQKHTPLARGPVNQLIDLFEDGTRLAIGIRNLNVAQPAAQQESLA